MYGSGLGEAESDELLPLRREKRSSWHPLVLLVVGLQCVILLGVGVLLLRGTTSGTPGASAIAPLASPDERAFANIPSAAATAAASTPSAPGAPGSASPAFSDRIQAELRRRAMLNLPDEANEERVSNIRSTAHLPHKFALDFVTPREDQMMRGTCWDFATIGMLEHSYRVQGVANGWLAPDEYVRMSEQAYGITVLERCRQRPGVCLVPDDNVWMNSTEGGEIPLLYYLPEVNNSILPWDICPYVPKKGPEETSCPGMDKALQRNPLKFEITRMETLYEIQSIKNHLFRHRRALGFSTPMTFASYYYPCTGKWAERAECKANPCPTPCPFEKFKPGSCCVRVLAPNYNIDGEFYSHGKTDLKAGGHAMLLVGWNDNYVTETGEVGGFILKNNWAGGSHSVQFWMQDISKWDESRICPNSRNPRNWYDCKSIMNCLSHKIRLYADVSFQPLHLKCVHDTLCSKNEHFTYFVKNASHAGDDMVQMCMFELDTRSLKEGDVVEDAEEDETVIGEEIEAPKKMPVPPHLKYREFCLGPLPLDDYARVFAPQKVRRDDPDRCGFYFIPYRLLQQWWRQYPDGFVTDFDTKWHPQSYAANARDYPHLDYNLVRSSTRKQNVYVFSGPFPHDMVTNDPTVAPPSSQAHPLPPVSSALEMLVDMEGAQNVVNAIRGN